MYKDIAHQTMDRFVKNLSLRIVDPNYDFFLENEREFVPLRGIGNPFNSWEGFKANLLQFKEPNLLGIEEHKVGRVKLYYGYSKDAETPGHYEILKARFSRSFTLDTGLEITSGSSIRMVRFVSDWGVDKLENFAHGLNCEMPYELVFG